MIPSEAVKPEPPEIPERSWITYYVPPLPADQKTVRFEMVGIGFDPGEPVTLRLTPTSDKLGAPAITQRVEATDPDGSFDTLVRARVTTYTLSVLGERSHKVLAAEQDPTVDLMTPTEPSAASSRATYC